MRLWPLVILGVVVLVLVAIMSRRGGGRQGMPYRKRDPFLSEAERSFYGVLKSVAAGRYELFAKVNLADLVFVPRGTQEGQAQEQTHRNKITQKHVDFVLCDTAKISPVAVAELDDSSHRGRRGKERDQFVDQALAAAGLPVVHVPARASYSVAELSALIETPRPAAPPGT